MSDPIHSAVEPQPGDPPPSSSKDEGGAEATPKDLFDLTPEQIRAVGEAQRLPFADNAADRTLVFRQMHVALLLILGGAIVATIGIVLTGERDATKLTAIISISTAVIGAGAALLPTGAAAGAAARILSRPIVQDRLGEGTTVLTPSRNGGQTAARR
jgi:hypothetical protein